MIQEVRLPRLGKAMTQATVVNLKVGLNDMVDQGQILCELETDKATLELESPMAGIVRHIFCALEQTLPVGAPLFVVSEANETISPEWIQKLQTEFALSSDSMKSERNQGSVIVGKNLMWIEPKQTSAVNGKKIPLTHRQRVIADKMLASKQQIPCFYLSIRVDITELLETLDRLNAPAPDQYSINDFLMLALTAGMKHYPIMTGQLGDNCIRLAQTIDIGLVVAAPNGPIVPVVRDVGSKTLEQISSCRRDLVKRAKEDVLTPDDVADGCITISNLGMAGIDWFIPIVVPGQCSILGVGRIFEMPVPSGKEILIRKMMNLNLSVDHRVANGADAAQFLDFVKKQLEHPAELVGHSV